MSMRLYTCMESQDTTSPSRAWASSTARAVFPEAVGPARHTIGFIGDDAPFEGFLKFWGG